MSTTAAAGPQQGAEQDVKQHDKQFSYVQLSCSFCKFRKRKCDGENPCSNCKKYKQVCVYFADSDRRRRKYHTDYIGYLEGKSDVLSKFIAEFVKDSPELSNMFNEKLQQALESSAKKSTDKSKDAPDSSRMDDDMLNLLEEANKLRLDDDDNARVKNSRSLLSHSSEYSDVDLQNHDSPYSEQTLSSYEASSSEDSNPLTMNGLNIAFKDDAFKEHLLDSFEDNFCPFAHCFKMIMPSARAWEFSSPVPSKQLLLCSIFAVGSVYSKHPYAVKSRKAFIAEAEYIAVNTCRHPLDIYLVLGLTLLSMYELGMGNDSISYLFNSMACSLTQHMGLHISYDQTGDTRSATYAPKASPLRSSTLWGICLQDRIVTNLCNVQSCIHFKRIIAPPYQTVLSPENDDYIAELSFAYHTRLWYIFDRFMDQICSESSDIGDTLQRTKLLETALTSFSEFKSTLPSPLVMRPGAADKHVLALHYTYYSLLCQYHKAFIKITPKSTQMLINCAVSAGDVLSRCEATVSFEHLPYNMIYLIYSNALIYLIVLSKEKEDTSFDSKAEESRKKFMLHFQTSLHALISLGTIWKRAKRDINILKQLALQNGLHFEEFEEPSAVESTSVNFDSKIQTPDDLPTGGEIPNLALFLTSPGSSDYAPSDIGTEYENPSFVSNNSQTAFANSTLHNSSQRGMEFHQHQPNQRQQQVQYDQKYQPKQVPQSQYPTDSLSTSSNASPFVQATPTHSPIPQYAQNQYQVPYMPPQEQPQAQFYPYPRQQDQQYQQFPPQIPQPQTSYPPVMPQGQDGFQFERGKFSSNKEFYELMNQFHPGQFAERPFPRNSGEQNQRFQDGSAPVFSPQQPLQGYYSPQDEDTDNLYTQDQR